MSDVDAGLVEALRRGEPEGTERLLDRYGDGIYRLALSIAGVEEDAVAAVENALRTVAVTIDTFTGESPFGSWIYRTVAHAAYERLGGRRPHSEEIAVADVMPPLDAEGHFEPMDDWSNQIDAQALHGRVGRILSAAIDALPVDYRAALVMHDVEGAATPDIAEILGVDVPVAKLRLHRARLFLRKRLSEYFESARAR